MLSEFLRKVESREAVIGVVGLGYVGLPLAIAFADAGFMVWGIEKDEKKIGNLRNGESYLRHISASEFSGHIESGKLRVVSDVEEVSDMDAVIVCVPTPLTENRAPDLSLVELAMEEVGKEIVAGSLVCLESTTYPGTTAGKVKMILEVTSGLEAGREFFLAYSPERQDPGNPIWKTRNVPKVVGGLNDDSSKAAEALYGAVMEKVVPVSSLDTAEMVKIHENVYRAVNVALVNEMKILCYRLGIDVWEVIKAANTKPFGFQAFWPGPGLGGHCTPIDPFYLTWRARQVGMSTRFIELAGEINSLMPEYVVGKVQDALNRRVKCLCGSSVLVLGVAYKPEVNDVRESPALKVMTMLEERGAIVDYHDPFVDSCKLPNGKLRISNPLDSETFKDLDCVVLVTDHEMIDYEFVYNNVDIIVDTRGRFKEENKFPGKLVVQA